MSSERDEMTHSQRAAMGATAGDIARAGQELTVIGDAPAPGPLLESWQQMYALLTHAAGIDGRVRGEYEARSWLKVLAGLPIEGIERAITTHYRQSKFPVMPANVIHIIEEGGAL